MFTQVFFLAGNHGNDLSSIHATLPFEPDFHVDEKKIEWFNWKPVD